MRNKPLISVIIPVYNCEKYLGEAIESVIDQTYDHIEIIVINDGSVDQSEKVAKKYNKYVKYFFQNNNGIGSARNKGIQCSTGDYLSFLDSDDIWVRDKLKIQIEALNSDESIDAVFGHVEQFLSPEILKDLKMKYKCPKAPMPGRLASTILISKNNFLTVGHFTNKQRLGVDLDWYLKAEEKRLKIIMLDTVLLKRRIHSSNIGILQKDKRTDYIRHLKQSLDRRRKNNLL